MIELEPQMQLLDIWLENRNDNFDLNDFIIFPILRSLSIVDELSFSTNVNNYMVQVAKATGVNLLFEQAK